MHFYTHKHYHHRQNQINNKSFVTNSSTPTPIYINYIDVLIIATTNTTHTQRNNNRIMQKFILELD